MIFRPLNVTKPDSSVSAKLFQTFANGALQVFDPERMREMWLALLHMAVVIAILMMVVSEAQV